MSTWSNMGRDDHLPDGATASAAGSWAAWSGAVDDFSRGPVERGVGVDISPGRGGGGIGGDISPGLVEGGVAEDIIRGPGGGGIGGDTSPGPVEGGVGEDIIPGRAGGFF